MIKVYLLKEYQGYRKGDIIEVSNNIAFGLVDSKVARNVRPGDFMKKTNLGETKAFKQAPSTKKIV